MIQIDDALKILKQDQGLHFAKDLRSTYYSCSPSFSLAAGIGKNGTIQGKSDTDLPWDTYVEELCSHDNHVITTHTPWSGYECGRTAFSSDIAYCLSNKIPMINHHNEIVGVFGTMIILPEKINTFLASQLNQRQKTTQTYHLATPPTLQQLTTKELICWFFTIRGKTVKQIAHAMKISPKTVEFHLINIKNKLNLKYKKDLIDYAFANNLLKFIPPAIRNENYVDFLREG